MTKPYYAAAFLFVASAGGALYLNQRVLEESAGAVTTNAVWAARIGELVSLQSALDAISEREAFAGPRGAQLFAERRGEIEPRLLAVARSMDASALKHAAYAHIEAAQHGSVTDVHRTHLAAHHAMQQAFERLRVAQASAFAQQREAAQSGFNALAGLLCAMVVLVGGLILIGRRIFRAPGFNFGDNIFSMRAQGARANAD